MNTEKASPIFSAALLLGAFTLLSMVLGLVRDRLLAASFGAGPELDAYLAAFRIPDLVYGILITGGISASFLPVLAAAGAEGNEKKAWEFANNILNAIALAFLVLAGVIAVFAPAIIPLIVPGFSEELRELAVNLTRVMLVGTVFLGISSVFSGILQYANRFFFFALAPVAYNLGIVAGILFLGPFLGIWGAALGVIGGALLHALIQIPSSFSAGFRWRPILHFSDRSLREVFFLALPRTIGAVTYYLNLIAMTAMASLLSAGSVTIFTFANTIHTVPVRLVGSSFALASFAPLARAFSHERREEFARAFSESFRMAVFLALPASILLFALRLPVISLIYQTGAFDREAAETTAAVLGVFSPGIAAYALIPLLVRAFFARHNTALPTAIGIGAVALNIALALLLFAFSPFVLAPIGHVLGFEGDVRILALPLAMAGAGIVQAKTLLLFLWKDISPEHGRIIFSGAKTLVSSLALGSVLLLLPPALFLSVSGAFQAGVLGILAYVFAALLLRSSEMRRILQLP